MKPLFVLLLCVLHIAKSHIFPIGHETEYDYEAFVQVATEYPSLHTSEFLINSKLYITGINNGAFIRFKDVTHTVYTGKGDKLYTDSTKIGLDQESQLLLKPFVIMYNEKGVVENILIDPSDMPWSVNIKKGIASLLQLDVHQIISGERRGFFTEEQTVHGNCMIQYAITPGFDGNIRVFKHHNAYSCEEFKFDRFLNLFSPKCDNRRGEVLTISSERFYDIRFVNNQLDINHIESFNSIIFNPFYNNDQNIFVNQTLHKLQMKEMNEELLFNTNDKIPLILKNDIMNYDLEEEIYDISGGRQIVNQQLVMQKAMESLKNIFNYIRKNHILFTEGIKDQKQTMSFLFHQIKLMNLQTLEHFYRTLTEEKDEDAEDLVELFLQALPFAGSYSSSVFIRDLITQFKIRDDIAIKMLQNVPFYLKNLNKKVLYVFFELINEKDLPKEVMKTSLLTFASMVNKAVDRYGEIDDDLRKFVYFYLDRFEQARDEEIQTFFMHALTNLRTNKVTFYLETLIRGVKPGIYLTPRCKVLAMWAIRKKIMKYPGELTLMFWPMLINQHEDFEVRATALQILLLSATMSSHMKIYWFMQSVTDYDLQNYYYTMLVEFTRTTGSCYDINIQRAKNMLRWVKKPRNPTIYQTLKLVQLAELFDAHYGFGIQNQAIAMGNLMTKGFIWVDVQQSPQVEDMESVKQSVQLYLRISDNMRKLILNRQTDIDINQLFLTSMKPNDVELEIVKVRHGKIIRVINLDLNTMRITYEMLQKRRESSKKGIVNYHLDQFVGEEILIPSDLGVPVSLFYQMPALGVTKINFGLGHADKGTMNWKFTFDNFWWYQHKTGLAVYNPVANLWHGSRRVLTLDVHLPVDIETKVGTENGMKMSLNKDGEQSDIRRGFQSHEHNHMFMYSDDNGEIVGKMCTECKPFTIVSENDNIHNKEIISENNVGDIKYEHALFDCDRNVSDSTMSYLKDKFSKSNPKMNIATAMKYWRVYDKIFMERGMCGIGLWYEIHGQTPEPHDNPDSKKNDMFCEIGKDYVIDMHNQKVTNKISGDWKFYAGECDQTCKWSISVKKVEGDKFLGVQLKYLNDVVEIYPQLGYQVWVNGKMLKHLTTGYFDGAWFNYKILGQENMLILRVKNIGVRIQHDGNSIKLSLPEKMDNLHTGYCYGVSKLPSPLKI